MVGKLAKFKVNYTRCYAAFPINIVMLCRCRFWLACRAFLPVSLIPIVMLSTLTASVNCARVANKAMGALRQLRISFDRLTVEKFQAIIHNLYQTSLGTLFTSNRAIHEERPKDAGKDAKKSYKACARTTGQNIWRKVQNFAAHQYWGKVQSWRYDRNLQDAKKPRGVGVGAWWRADASPGAPGFGRQRSTIHHNYSTTIVPGYKSLDNKSRITFY